MTSTPPSVLVCEWCGALSPRERHRSQRQPCLCDECHAARRKAQSGGAYKKDARREARLLFIECWGRTTDEGDWEPQYPYRWTCDGGKVTPRHVRERIVAVAIDNNFPPVAMLARRFALDDHAIRNVLDDAGLAQHYQDAIGPHKKKDDLSRWDLGHPDPSWL